MDKPHRLTSYGEEEILPSEMPRWEWWEKTVPLLRRHWYPESQEMMALPQWLCLSCLIVPYCLVYLSVCQCVMYVAASLRILNPPQKNNNNNFKKHCVEHVLNYFSDMHSLMLFNLGAQITNDCLHMHIVFFFWDHIQDARLVAILLLKRVPKYFSDIHGPILLF